MNEWMTFFFFEKSMKKFERSWYNMKVSRKIAPSHNLKSVTIQHDINILWISLSTLGIWKTLFLAQFKSTCDNLNRNFLILSQQQWLVDFCFQMALWRIKWECCFNNLQKALVPFNGTLLQKKTMHFEMLGQMLFNYFWKNNLEQEINCPNRSFRRGDKVLLQGTFFWL